MNAESLRELALREVAGCVNGANLLNLFSRELGKAMRLPSHNPSLLAFISGVVRICSKPKVDWINAWRIVARVTAMQPFGDRSIMNHPRYSVSVARNRPEGQLSVTPWGFICGPLPAFIRASFGDLAPKSSSFNLGEIDKLVGIRNGLSSFIHKLILYVEVRAREAGRTALALAYCTKPLTFTQGGF